MVDELQLATDCPAPDGWILLNPNMTRYLIIKPEDLPERQLSLPGKAHLNSTSFPLSNLLRSQNSTPICPGPDQATNMEQGPLCHPIGGS